MSVTFEDVTKRYEGEAAAIDAVSFEARSGELVVLLGESGCGKTTTLKLINRLIEPTSGRIRIDGEDTAGTDPVQLRRRIGYVFQDVGLFPHMTVGENIGITPSLLGLPPAEIEDRTGDLMQLVGLDPADFRGRRPRDLSGGQRQRAGFARALAARPKLMLLDEPFGALDPLTRDRLQEEFRDIHDRLGLTSIFVTHDMSEGLLLADRLIVMRHGRIVQNGAPRVLMSSPADAYVEALLSAPLRQAGRIEALAGSAEGRNGA